MFRGPIHDVLSRDHVRLGGLLAQSVASAATIDLAAYVEFRAGLLRHIAIEEKVLFVDARARRGGERLPVTRQLHADHAALASLLVPSPTHALLTTIRDILVEHDPLEEGPGGLYDLCEQLAASEIADVLARMHAIAPVRMADHVDEERVHEHIARMLEARRLSPST
jgi:hypothetical protein